MEKEEWKKIEAYPYYISSCGRVYSIKRKQLLSKARKGNVLLYNNGYVKNCSINSLVNEYFGTIKYDESKLPKGKEWQRIEDTTYYINRQGEIYNIKSKKYIKTCSKSGLVQLYDKYNCKYNYYYLDELLYEYFNIGSKPVHGLSRRKKFKNRYCKRIDDLFYYRLNALERKFGGDLSNVPQDNEELQSLRNEYWKGVKSK